MTKKGKKFNSFEAMGIAMGNKPAADRTPKERKCMKCGTVMRLVSGTNVYICDGIVENEDKKTVPCGHRVIATVRS